PGPPVLQAGHVVGPAVRRPRPAPRPVRGGGGPVNTLPAILRDDLRGVMACFATGVAVITAAEPGRPPVGMAVNSFVSVSLEPPLVLFCAAHTSSTWPAIRAAGHFCANVLAAGQEELARAFARKGD